MSDSDSEQESGSIINIPKSTLELLRCGVCKKYLSSSPIFSYEDGLNVCHLCYNEQPLSAKDKRHFCNFLYAEAVQDFGFPCKYSDRGCTKIVRFNDTQHEDYCERRPFDCPGMKDGFKGDVNEIRAHLELEHKSMIVESYNHSFTITKQQVVPKQTKILRITARRPIMSYNKFSHMVAIEFSVYNQKGTENQFCSVSVKEISDREDKDIKKYYNASFQPGEDKYVCPDALFQRNRLVISNLLFTFDSYKQNITYLFELFNAETISCKISVHFVRV